MPAGLDIVALMTRLLRSARAAAGDEPRDFLELRMAGDQPIGQVGIDGRMIRIDTKTDQPVPGSIATIEDPQFPRSQRTVVKSLHQLTAVFGTLWVTVCVGLAPTAMLVTGVVMYVRMFTARARAKKAGVFWSGGGGWRSLHRWTASIAAVFLLVVIVTGI
jgi:preprotein translocase subunit SecG